eukprot:755457-Hanusia_phi.AAC.2
MRWSESRRTRGSKLEEEIEGLAERKRKRMVEMSVRTGKSIRPIFVPCCGSGSGSGGRGGCMEPLELVEAAKSQVRKEGRGGERTG